MRTIDHWEYAKLMIKDIHVPCRMKLAFMFGSVMPDFNKFSYMGHHVKDWARGHSFRVRRKEIIHFFRRHYRHSSVWWFLAGLKFHYLGDSFSRPHNPEFGYSSKDHVAYEWELHYAVRELLASGRHYPPAKVTGNLNRWLNDRHRQYLRKSTGIREDVYYLDSSLMGLWDFFINFTLAGLQKEK